MSLGARLSAVGAVAEPFEPPPPHVRAAALDDYTPETYLTVPSSEGSDAYHPDVVDTVTGWNGYRYWMGMTPYLDDGIATENPNIVASNDGSTWVVPAGLTNPISPYPGGGNYNSDTDMVLVPSEGLMYCFYRCTGGPGGEGHRYRTSADGVHWSGETVFHIEGSSNQQVSPSYVRVHAGLWRAWWIDLTARTLNTASASSPSGPWSTPVACDIDVPTGAVMWHLDVIRHDHMYYAVIYCDSAPAPIYGGIIGGVSYDGINWGESTDWLMKGNPATLNPLYRACLQPASGGFNVWVGATVPALGPPISHRIALGFVPDAEFA